METKQTYQSPLSDRYASEEMKSLFSPQFKYSTWRRLWLTLAEVEKLLGLPISNEQIDEMKKHLLNIDFKGVEEHEKKLKHNVLAHMEAFGEQCPLAKPIIQLGASPSYVTDNTNMIQMRDGLQILIDKLVKVIKQLSSFARKNLNLACLPFTHFQPTQLTTVGERTCLWIQELSMDLQELELRKKSLRFLGVKGVTGSQAPIFALFDNNHEKVQTLEHLVSSKMGFPHLSLVSSATYSRKQDVFVLNALTGVGISAHKFATDFRLLVGLKEMEESFDGIQSESNGDRVCAFSRFLISLSDNPVYTAAFQWLERSLDDSINSSLFTRDAFLTADAILELLTKITSNIVIYPKMIAKHIQEELPFIAAKNIVMASIKKNGERPEIHEKVRLHSQAANKRVKEEGVPNDLLERLLQDADLKLTEHELRQILNAENFIGRAPQQTKDFLDKEIDPLVDKYQNDPKDAFNLIDQ